MTIDVSGRKGWKQRTSRSFLSASSQSLSVGALAVSAYPLTIAAWFYPYSIDWGNIAGLGSASGAGRKLLFFSGTSSTFALYQQNDSGGFAGTTAASVSVSANCWSHGCVVYAASNSASIYANGGGKVTNTTNITTFGTPTATYIGTDGTGGNYVNGAIALPAIWNAALTDGEISQLAQGALPLDVRPQNLVFFPDLVTLFDQSPYRNQNLRLTNNNAAQIGRLCERVRLPQGRLWVVPPAAGTTVTPTTGSIIVAGSAPTVKQNILRQPTVGSVVVTGNAPTLKTNTIRQPAAGSVIVSGNAPAVVTGGNHVVNPNTGTIVVSGLAPTLKTNTIRQPTVGSIKVAGNAPTVSQSLVRQPTVGSVIVTGNAPVISYTSHVLRNPDAGQIIVRGNTPTVIATGALSAAQLAELYGGNIISKALADKKKKKKKKPPLEEMVFEISKSPEGKKEIIKALPKPIQEELPDPQLALVADLINKIEDASQRVQKKVEQIYRKRVEDDDEDDVFILLL